MPNFSKALDDDWEEVGSGQSGPSQDFDKYMQAQERARIKEAEEKAFVRPFEPRCHVCTHPFRDIIDSMLLKADLSFSELARRMPPGRNGRKLDHRQLSTHSKKHLGAGDAAIRAILEEEADLAQKDYTEGVRGAITHRGGLEVAFRKAYEDIVNGVAAVEPRDMIKIAEQLRKWDDETHAVQVDILRAQVSAIEEAIKRVLPKDKWMEVVNEAKTIYARESGQVMRPASIAPPAEPEIVDVDAVEEPVEMGAMGKV
jgi:hypothetical protein